MTGFAHFSRLAIWAAVLVFAAWEVPSVVTLKPKDVELNLRLKSIFARALEEHPDIKPPPGMSLSDFATMEEKAAALAEHVMQLAGPELEAWLGEAGELMHEIKLALKETNKKTRGQKMKKAVERFFHTVSQLVKKSKTCTQVKAAGVTPEARLGHSPLPFFGYPVFRTEIGATVLERRLPLNKLNRRKIDIKVGAEDYVIQGSIKKVLDFLRCFEDYKVVAQTLFPDGHWRSEPHKNVTPRPLYLQVQGVMRGGDVGEILVRECLDRVIRHMDFKLKKNGSLSMFVEEALAGEMTVGDFLKSEGVVGAIKSLRSYAQVQAGKFFQVVKDVWEAPTFEEKLKALNRHIDAIEPGPDDWSQPQAVRHHRRITLTLTTYPQPENNNKATKRMPSNVVTLGQVGDALEEIDWDML